jgi:hypothetical protein
VAHLGKACNSDALRKRLVSQGIVLIVSDHRGSNSQVIDFESVKIYPIFTVKIENLGKSNT